MTWSILTNQVSSLTIECELSLSILLLYGCRQLAVAGRSVTVEQNSKSTVDSAEISDDDRLWAALSWIPLTPLWPIIAIIMLLIEGKKERQFIRYHAILSLLTGLVGTLLLFLCVGFLVYLVMLFFAFKAYQGEKVRIPLLTDLAENQGWV
jgi:uncharacterized membrane protein